MIFEQPSALKQRISEVTQRKASSNLKIFENTSEFMLIDVGDIMRLSGNDYLVTGHAREGRFGIDEQPKFWVKKTIDLTTGEKKIIKLVFLETFINKVGGTLFKFLRSPEKEAAVLLKMNEHPNFMHGLSVEDCAGNIVRIIDFVQGPSLYFYLRDLKISHREYYFQKFSRVMQLFIESVEAILSLHGHGLHHGDIRADHIIVNNQTGRHVWIDFDYDVSCLEFDIFCLGNVLHQVVGKGRHSLHDIRLQASNYPDFNSTLISEDMSLMFRYRVANLRKLYPYIPKPLNEILMRFSAGVSEPYKKVGDLLADLRFLFPS
ncbi:MAG: protein kinase [Proteobacteria bacterium]|nr:protein kinase [Desulfobacula sp.]MBU3954746.1 protein kinase [Pseudomonadota bacterium]MBU4129564.1 protein kinase [Pseudomonadota bacterium]